MNGKLRAHPLAELIKEISLKSLSGTLRLEYERVKAVVYFEEGQVVFAASNVRSLRLAEYLKKQGLVSEQDLVPLANRSDPAVASALQANGVLKSETIDALFATQVADILRVGLLWTTGTWEFDGRSRLGDSVRVKVDATALMMEAARRTTLDFISTRFQNPNELITPVVGMNHINSLLPAEGFILSRVESPMTVHDLITVSGLDEQEFYRGLYALTLGGYLERQYSLAAFRSAPGTTSVVTAGENAAEETATVTPPSPAEGSQASDEETLDQFFIRVNNSSNHYEVLDVSPKADLGQIKRSYYALARRYHPDKFHDQAQLHSRIESAFARITQAYETLTDGTARSAYDAKLAAKEKSRRLADSAPKPDMRASSGPQKPKQEEQKNTPEAGPETAENSFKEGFAALQQGHTKLAITHLATAARVAPQEPRYRAYYGRALAADKQTQRVAETEFQTAIKLDPSNATYRVMLGELYSELGFIRRAQTEVQRALTIDPNNVAGQALLRKLEVARKEG